MPCTHESVSRKPQFSGKVSHTHKLKCNVQNEIYHEGDIHRLLWKSGQEDERGEGELASFGDDKIGLSSSIKDVFTY